MRAILVSATLVAALFAPVRAHAGPELTLKRTIPLPGVEGRIDHMAFDPRSARLFVAALENGSLEVVDLDKGERVKSITGLKEPQGVAWDPDSNRVLVACGGDSSLRAYDGATMEPKETVTIGDDADNVRYDAAAHRVLVGFGSGALAVLNSKDLTRLGDTQLPGHPESFQIEPGSSRVFINVPGGAIAGGGGVVVADHEARRVSATWKLKDAGRNFPMALDAPSKRLYIACRRPARLLAIDTDSGATVASVECVGDADDVFVDTPTGRVYITGGDGAVDVVEGKDHGTYTRAGSTKTRAGARTSLLAADRRAIYIACPKRSDRGAEIREYALPD